MNSSISSSEALQAGDAGSSDRRIYFRILLAIALGMTAALVIFRIFAELNDGRPESIMGRVLEAREALPQVVAQPGDLVMVFGSSMVEAGFSPRQFDQEMAAAGRPVTSFNFGFGGLNPYFQDFLSRRIVEAFEAADRRLALTLVEFNPFQTTVTRNERAKAIRDSYLTMLASPRELWKIVLEDPRRGIRLLVIHYLRNDISAEMTTNFLLGHFDPPPPSAEFPLDEAVDKRLNEVLERLGQLFEEEYPDYEGEDWRWAWQGGGTLPEERSEETLRLVEEYYELIRHPHYLARDLRRRIENSDILELNFDEELIQAFIRTVNNFKPVSDRLEVILLPRDTEWVPHTPEVAGRLQSLLERIERETGVPVRNFQDTGQIPPQMFGDVTHLNRYGGAVAFTRLLVETYSQSD